MELQKFSANAHKVVYIYVAIYIYLCLDMHIDYILMMIA